MKILMLSDIDSAHSANWANGLAASGVEVSLCGFYSKPESLQRYNLNVELFAASRKAGVWSKTDFVAIVPWVKKIYDRVKPDVVHAHYASSYGLLARKLEHPKSIVSVWGSDVYSFPNSGNIAKNVLSSNLNFASLVLSTSNDMATRTRELTSSTVHVVPFGVDTTLFFPKREEVTEMRIGTVKALEDTYGIDRLIEVFAILKKSIPQATLHIAGEGSQEGALRDLTSSLGVTEHVSFYGAIANDEVPAFLNKLNLFMALSRAESFGVSVIEAAACGVPAIVSNVGGLPETVVEGKTGHVMSMDDLDEVAARAVELLSNNDQLHLYSEHAVQMVNDKFSRQACVNQLIGYYRGLAG